jgi:hypothetical protein
VGELVALREDVSGREPTVREKAAAAAFLAQFYNGVENILKRTCSYFDVPLPTGEAWHVGLFRLFCSPSHPDLPLLLDENLASDLAPFRRFRHVALHSYGFQLDWSRMSEGVARVDSVLGRFKASLGGFLDALDR